ncbi:MAG: nitrate reductase [Nitratiruptor sp.]|nr:nitrate reductase [Nitratiruptor sp.]NPA83527.1 chaperone NapD [Campylobacterota bacterium]
MTLSSCVVRCHPQDLEAVRQRIEESGVCDIHLVDKQGYIIVTIEGENIEEEIQKLKVLQFLDGVLSAEMVYSYSEDQLDALREDLEIQDPVPEILEKDVPAEQIVYNGDLKKKFI